MEGGNCNQLTPSSLEKRLLACPTDRDDVNPIVSWYVRIQVGFDFFLFFNKDIYSRQDEKSALVGKNMIGFFLYNISGTGTSVVLLFNLNTFDSICRTLFSYSHLLRLRAYYSLQ